jgi:hypothetical protein
MRAFVSPQAWGLWDKMKDMSKEDMLVIMKPFLSSLVRQEAGGKRLVDMKPTLCSYPSPLTAAHLPPTLWSKC